MDISWGFRWDLTATEWDLGADLDAAFYGVSAFFDENVCLLETNERKGMEVSVVTTSKTRSWIGAFGETSPAESR